jgi:hypothetical protein
MMRLKRRRTRTTCEEDDGKGKIEKTRDGKMR